MEDTSAFLFWLENRMASVHEGEFFNRKGQRTHMERKIET